VLIAIATNPKSGSSMIASIFVAHGVWAGRSLNKNKYQTYEWYEMKQAMKRYGPPLEGDGFHIPDNPERLDSLVRSKRGKWLFKSAPELIGSLLKYNPKIIKIRRDIASIISSQCVDKEWEEVINKRFALMENLGGVWVDSDQVINGDLSSLEKAFDYCDIELDYDKAMACIDQSLWHHRT
jgi:hypothetical protein